MSLESRESMGLAASGRHGSLPPRHPGSLGPVVGSLGAPLSPMRRHSSPRSSTGALLHAMPLLVMNCFLAPNCPFVSPAKGYVVMDSSTHASCLRCSGMLLCAAC